MNHVMIHLEVTTVQIIVCHTQLSVWEYVRTSQNELGGNEDVNTLANACVAIQTSQDIIW